MKLQLQKPHKSLNKAYLKEKVNRNDIDAFKSNLNTLLSKIDEKETEEHHKSPVSEFLKDTWYKELFEINTKGRTDFVIHNGKTAKDTVGVIFEVKSPANHAEMISEAKPNKKAMQELILYYLRERVDENQTEVKHLIITNIWEWYIFDEAWFEKHIFRSRLKKDYETFKLSGKDTKFFFDSIAKPFLDELKEGVPCTYFNFKDYEKVARPENTHEDNKLIALYKLLSPAHLLKQPFANDSNSLDTKFYAELLHIIGLEEVKDGSKKLIQRKENPDAASLLESAIMKLEDKDSLRQVSNPSAYGATGREQLYNMALELCITWINRVLFIKLLEGQLVTYHKGDKDYLFLNTKIIGDYDELNDLFFLVLAEPTGSRRDHLRQRFSKVPYLNSSLFDRTLLEREAIEINTLNNRHQLPLFGGTVLKNDQGKKRTGKLPALQYLFEFLDAYDFSSDGGEAIQEQNKNLINASVLGLIFEKINGYKDGSFFTPGFVTMYMCHEAIRRAVVQKFNDTKGWQCETIEQLYDKIQDKKEANSIINSIKICDPAVGSGHFLVSALNELIAIKSELKILRDRQGKTLRDYNVTVENDALVVTDEDGKLLDYHPKSPESQRIQEALFHEKETIIENCLFGVDINPNSVKICRLRLWIELLKNAYYTAESNFTELETLPNIDINIKCGNSLISRFALDSDLSKALKKSKWTIDSYLVAVQSYRNAESKDEKRTMEELIESIKSNFRTEISDNDPKVKKLQKLNTEYYLKYQADKLFDAKLTSAQKKDKEAFEKEINKLDSEIKEIKDNKIYENAFEWRFEFPEVLDNDGNFIGFDVIIGNPPYVALQKMQKEQKGLEVQNFKTYSKLSDLYCLFYEKGIQLLKSSGLLSFITSNSWLRTKYGELLRKYLLENTNPLLLLNIEDAQVFSEATVESNIIVIKKHSWGKNLRAVSLGKDFILNTSIENYFANNAIKVTDLPLNGWTIGNEIEEKLKNKIENDSINLSEWGNEIYRGFTTGFNEAFFVNTETKNVLIKEDKNCEHIIKRSLRGKDISKYFYHWQDIWIIIIKSGWTNANRGNYEPEDFFRKEYPSIYRHFKHIGDTIKGKGKGLYNREDKGDYWWELRPCVYYDHFEKEKIIWGELSDVQKFSYDHDGLYGNNTVFFMTGENLKYLLSIFNSRISKWYFNIISTSSGMGTNRWLKYKIEQLPVKNISIGEQKPFIDLVDKVITAKQSNPSADTSALEKELDQLVYQLYGLTEEEIAIIENN